MACFLPPQGHVSNPNWSWCPDCNQYKRVLTVCILKLSNTEYLCWSKFYRFTLHTVHCIQSAYLNCLLLFSGLAPYCLSILKTCHQLTEKLVGMTMGNSQNLRSMETITDLVAIAKRVGARVDDVMKALYPPLDPRLLEARSVLCCCCFCLWYIHGKCNEIQWSLYFKITHGTKKMWSYITGGLKLKVIGASRPPTGSP